ncbi:MAG: hypothetical protein GXO83_00450 [Chlorobi bacterium]|nr:hypothetical protein [Chlorobiota bacterium]
MKVKRVLHIIVSLVLLLTTSGVTVSAHYCPSLLIEKNIDITSDSSCDDENCCTDEAMTCQVITEFIASAFQISGPDVVQITPGNNSLHEFISSLNEDTERDKGVHILKNLSPPLISPDHSVIQAFLL